MPGSCQQRHELATESTTTSRDKNAHRQAGLKTRLYDAGSLNAISSALYPAPLMATTMYWRPLSM
jgi:hypothetical protein